MIELYLLLIEKCLSSLLSVSVPTSGLSEDSTCPSPLLSDRPIVGASLKMYLGFAETTAYLRSLAHLSHNFTDVAVFVVPSFPVLAEAGRILSGTGVAFGAQDGHWADRGPFTGSVSPAMLSELGCCVVELGHHERRAAFGEGDGLVARKVAAAHRNGLIPLACVGEQHPGDDVSEVVARQAEAIFNAADPGKPVILAYEPVWAIGADAPARPDRIEAACAVIGALAVHRPGRTRVLYGGAVSAGRTPQVMCCGVDGVFVGRAALRVSGLAQIVEEVRAAWRP